MSVLQEQSIRLYRLRALGACVVLCIGAGACAPLQRAMDPHDRFAVYYDNKASADDLAPYATLVLDGDVHPDLAELKSNQHILLGYVSVGEIKAGSPLEYSLPADLMLQKNPHWNSTLVDMRRAEWQSHLLDSEIPTLLAKGFDGVMLDTIDSPLHLEATDPARYTGMQDAAIGIVKTIRARYPSTIIMVNRAFAILPFIAAETDILLAESTLSQYDLASGSAAIAKDEDYWHYIQKIRAAQGVSPQLTVYSLDYWDMNDAKGVTHLYEIQRNQGFVPYVTTPDLRTIHHESNASSPARSPIQVAGAANRNDEKGYTHA